MALTDKSIKAAKASDKQTKLFDSGGLFLLVSPSGGKWWRLKYRFGGKEKLLSLGRVLNRQSSQMTEQARRMKQRKLVSSLSYRVATRRNCLSLLKNRSTKLRSLYTCQSTERCSVRLDRGGMTA